MICGSCRLLKVPAVCYTLKNFLRLSIQVSFIVKVLLSLSYSSVHTRQQSGRKPLLTVKPGSGWVQCAIWQRRRQHIQAEDIRCDEEFMDFRSKCGSKQTASGTAVECRCGGIRRRTVSGRRLNLRHQVCAGRSLQQERFVQTEGPDDSTWTRQNLRVWSHTSHQKCGKRLCCVQVKVSGWDFRVCLSV